MKRLVLTLVALITIGTSQASTTTTNTQLTTIGSSAKIVTKKELVHVSSIRIPKPKLFRSNPLRKSVFVNYKIDDDDDIFIQDEDLVTAYRRKDLDKIKTNPSPGDPDGIITEDIRWRLFLARTAAMVRYRQIHG